MKLFLASLAISPQHLEPFTTLVGKSPKETRLGLIENAADVEPTEPDWVTSTRDSITSHGFQVSRIDLRRYLDKPAELRSVLGELDVIWLGGGNTYYLRYLLAKTGADLIIKDLVEKGAVYGGGSAGAVVAGPTLNHFQTADDPADAPDLILTGLELTQVVVVPHTDDPKSGPIVAEINRNLLEAGYDTAPLTDAQALVIDGPRTHLI
jgi:dipeptidase E